MTALPRSLVLLSLLCVAQAHVYQDYVETLKTNLQTATVAHEKLKTQWNVLASQKAELWTQLQEQLDLMRAELPPELPTLNILVDQVQNYSDMSGNLLDQMIQFLQTQVQQNQQLLENHLEFVDSLEQQLPSCCSPLCHSFRRGAAPSQAA